MGWVFNQGSVRNCNRVATLPVAKSSQVEGAGAVATAAAACQTSTGTVRELTCACRCADWRDFPKTAAEAARTWTGTAGTHLPWNITSINIRSLPADHAARSAAVVGGVRMTFYLWIPNCKLLTCFTQVMADQARPGQASLSASALTASVHVHVQLPPPPPPREEVQEGIAV